MMKSEGLWNIARRPATPAEMVSVHEAAFHHTQPAVALLRFAEYRRLVPDTKSRLETVWGHSATMVDLLRGRSGGGWRNHSNMTDPQNSMCFDRLVTRELGFNGDMAAMSFFFRARLALEAIDPHPAVSLREWGAVTGFMDVYYTRTRNSVRASPSLWEGIWNDLEHLTHRDLPSFHYIAELMTDASASDRTVSDRTVSDRTVLDRVVQVATRTATLEQNWPQTIAREGASAVAFHRGDRALKLRLVLQRIPPGTARAVFKNDGTAEWKRAVPLDGLVKAGHLPPSSQKAIAQFIARCEQTWIHKPAHVTKLLAAVETLAALNPASLLFIGRRLAKLKDHPVGEISTSLQRAATFCRKALGRCEIEGPVVAFYHKNRGQIEIFKSLFKAISRLLNPRVIFDEAGRYKLIESSVPPAREPTSAITPFPYAEATVWHDLPSPTNNWGRRDVARTPESVTRDVATFFARLEQRLGKRPAQMWREWGLPDYFHIQHGDILLPKRCLTASFLDEAHLTGREQERLRHLQALLAVVRDLKFEPGRGPYREAGLLLRYYRLLGGVTIKELRNTLKGMEHNEEDLSLLELGWFAESDPTQLARIAEAIGVPRMLRAPMVDHLIAIYDGVDRRQLSFEPRGVATYFPDDTCDIPYFSQTQNTMTERIGQWARRMRKSFGLTQEAMAARVGLHPCKLRELENRGVIGQPTFLAWVRYLKRRVGREDDIRQLRWLRASLEMHSYPVQSGGGLRMAGLRLRFARCLVPQLTAKNLAQRLSTPGQTVTKHTILLCENGMAEMPRELLADFGRLLIDAAALTAPEAGRFVTGIRSMYDRAKIS